MYSITIMYLATRQQATVGWPEKTIRLSRHLWRVPSFGILSGCYAICIQYYMLARVAFLCPLGQRCGSMSVTDMDPDPTFQFPGPGSRSCVNIKWFLLVLPTPETITDMDPDPTFQFPGPESRSCVNNKWFLLVLPTPETISFYNRKHSKNSHQ